MTLKLSSIKDALPIASTTFIIIGIIKALAYYYLFGIRIIDYIEFSESLLLFLDDLLIFAFALLFAGFAAFLYRKFPTSLRIMGIGLSISNAIYLYVVLRNYYHISLYFSIVEAVALLIISLVGFYYLYSQINSQNTNQNIEIFMVLLLALFSLVSTIMFRIKKDYETAINPDPDRRNECI